MGLAPSTSTTMMLALGDALALTLSAKRHFSRVDFAKNHPAGSLGKALSKVDSILRPLDRCRLANDNWLGLGCCLEKQGLYREAVFSLAHAAELGYPINPKPLYLLAQCCCSIQDTESAKRVLEIAVTAGDEADAEQMSYRKMSQELLANLV